MKKSIFKTMSVVAAITMCLSLSVPTAAASNAYSDMVAPCYETTQLGKSELTISSTKATCKSSANNCDSVTITAVQTLEKHWGLWIWNEVDGANWTKTVNASAIYMSNTKSGLDSGTYRLKTVFTLTESDGTTETITVYSTEKTI